MTEIEAKLDAILAENKELKARLSLIESALGLHPPKAAKGNRTPQGQPTQHASAQGGPSAE